MIRGYFRTTKKASLHLDSSLGDHGLDSLDKVELCIQVEDELGYLIDGEKLALFHKPKHFVNFINQMEGYRAEFNKLPHEGIQATYKSDFQTLFPGVPGMWYDSKINSILKIPINNLFKENNAKYFTYL